jgi:predicted nuclease of predicted toxin-antitoxin system
MKKQYPWRLIADLNISIRTVSFLQEKGIDIQRVDKSISTDQELLQKAQHEDRVILTFDKDFGEIYHFGPEKNYTIILLHLKDQRSKMVNPIVHSFLAKNDFLLLKNKLIIVYEDRLRIVQ